MRGVPTPWRTCSRWEEIADKAQARIGDHLSAWTLPHWMMALAAAGREQSAEAMQKGLQESPNPVVREVAAPVCEAIRAHRRGAHPRVVELMAPLTGRLSELGGSHAQRDVLVQLLADARGRMQRAAA